MTIHLIRYCIKKFPDVTNRLRNRQDISSTDFLMERNCIFSSADDEGTGITCTYTKGKNGFKLERSKMVLTERSGRYAVGYICMIVYTIL